MGIKDYRKETRVKVSVPKTIYDSMASAMAQENWSFAKLISLSLNQALKEPEAFAAAPFYRIKSGAVARHHPDANIIPEERQSFKSFANALHVKESDLALNMIARYIKLDLRPYSALLRETQILNPDFELLNQPVRTLKQSIEQMEHERQAAGALSAAADPLVTPYTLDTPAKITEWQGFLKKVEPKPGLTIDIPAWKR